MTPAPSSESRASYELYLEAERRVSELESMIAAQVTANELLLKQNAGLKSLARQYFEAQAKHNETPDDSAYDEYYRLGHALREAINP